MNISIEIVASRSTIKLSLKYRTLLHDDWPRISLERSMKAQRLARLACLGILHLGLYSIAGCDSSPESVQRTQHAIDRSEIAGSMPFRIRLSFPEGPYSIDRKQLDASVALYWPTMSASLSKVIHAIHAFENYPATPSDRLPSIDQLKALLLDNKIASQWYGNRFLLVRTSYGLRYVTADHTDASQAHVDQTLAILAELGVPRTQPIHVDECSDNVEGLLGDTTANFQLRGEFEWSALSLVLYYPTRKTWQNRFQESFDMNAVAHALMSKRLGTASCGGAHVLCTLATILQVDEQYNLLSDETRDTVRTYLFSISRFVSDCQLEDGSIDPMWNYRLENQDWYRKLTKMLSNGGLSGTTHVPHQDLIVSTLPDKLLSTGHSLEWMIRLPVSRQPPREFYERSISFLEKSLAKPTSSESREKNYCQYSHAIYVLLLFSNVE